MAYRLLDTFCKAGGCTRGYQMAGFHVTGVDIEPQPRYVGDEFVQCDAIAFIREHGHEYDAIHASPPCQDFCAMKHFPNVAKRGNLIDATRAALLAAARPYVIENVPGAPLFKPITLCGKVFGLKVYRHRLFESCVPLTAPAHLPHNDNCRKRMLSRNGFVTVAGHGGMGMGPGGMAYARAAMGIDWTNRDELSQAIPPAYTFFIGTQLLAYLEGQPMLPLQLSFDHL